MISLPRVKIHFLLEVETMSVITMRVVELLSGVQRFAIQFLFKRAKVRLKGLFRASTDPLFFLWNKSLHEMQPFKKMETEDLFQ